MATFKPGYYLVEQDCAVDFGGAWAVRFKPGQILHYTPEYKMLKWDIGKWKNIRPAIQDVENLDLNDYGREYERERIIKNFEQCTKKLTKTQVDSLIKKQHVDVDALLEKAGIEVKNGMVKKSDIPTIIKLIKGSDV